MWGDKEKRDKYYPVAYELYGKNILDEEQIRGILGTKQRSAKIDNESKSRDDDMELWWKQLINKKNVNLMV